MSAILTNGGNHPQGSVRLGKSRLGNFFEDFRLNQVLQHGTPRTVSEGDISLYLSLTGSRYAVHSSEPLALELGLSSRPLDDLLVFNIAFGKTVSDISLNAVANLGYAEVNFLAPVFPGDTLRCESTVIGLRENANRKSGIVYVRSTCYDKNDSAVLRWVRWVMVHKRNPATVVGESFVPSLDSAVTPHHLTANVRLGSPGVLEKWCEATACSDLWEAYLPGERINHPEGMTIEDADHMSAARLYQNNARPHFDALAMAGTRFGKRLVYGGHVISVCRALTYCGLENVLGILAINGGTHVAPVTDGDTLYAYTEVLERWKLPGRSDVGALRLRMIGLKNCVPDGVAAAMADKATYHPAVVLDFDYTVLIPRMTGSSAGKR